MDPWQYIHLSTELLSPYPLRISDFTIQKYNTIVYQDDYGPETPQVPPQLSKLLDYHFHAHPGPATLVIGGLGILVIDASVKWHFRYGIICFYRIKRSVWVL